MATGAKTAEANIKATTPNGQKKYEHWLKSKDQGDRGRMGRLTKEPKGR
jgi:hypothetical protein